MRKVSIASTYKLDNLLLKKPRANEHWIKRLIWSYKMLNSHIRNSRQLDQGTIFLMGHLKLVLNAFYKKLCPFYHPDYIQDQFSDEPIEDDFEPKYVEPQFGSTTLDAKWEAKVFNMCLYEGIKLPDKAAKNPRQLFDKLWPKIEKLADGLKQADGKNYKWNKFLEKISGRSDTRLTLVEQKFIKDNLKSVPENVLMFLTGTTKPLDFSAQMRLNPNLDLYQFSNLPTGGRLAQTMPELCLVTFHAIIKQQCLAMSMNLNKLLAFIKRFIGQEELKKYYKIGTVYRIGAVKGKREIYPATTSIEGLIAFVGTWQGMEYNAKVNYGKAKYLDIDAYINDLRLKLGYDNYEDPEKEVWIPKDTVLPKSFIIKEYSSSKGYILTNISENEVKHLKGSGLHFTVEH